MSSGGLCIARSPGRAHAPLKTGRGHAPAAARAGSRPHRGRSSRGAAAGRAQGAIKSAAARRRRGGLWWGWHRREAPNPPPRPRRSCRPRRRGRARLFWRALGSSRGPSGVVGLLGLASFSTRGLDSTRREGSGVGSLSCLRRDRLSNAGARRAASHRGPPRAPGRNVGPARRGAQETEATGSRAGRREAGWCTEERRARGGARLPRARLVAHFFDRAPRLARARAGRAGAREGRGWGRPRERARGAPRPGAGRLGAGGGARGAPRRGAQGGAPCGRVGSNKRLCRGGVGSGWVAMAWRGAGPSRVNNGGSLWVANLQRRDPRRASCPGEGGRCAAAAVAAGARQARMARGRARAPLGARAQPCADVTKGAPAEQPASPRGLRGGAARPESGPRRRGASAARRRGSVGPGRACVAPPPAPPPCARARAQSGCAAQQGSAAGRLWSAKYARTAPSSSSCWSNALPLRSAASRRARAALRGGGGRRGGGGAVKARPHG